MGWQDAFVTRLNADGTKGWTQLLGTSTNTETINALAIGQDGAVYATGSTRSSVFEGITNSGGSDAFITRINQDGSKAWTKLLGGGSDDWAYRIKSSADGGIYVSGLTNSSVFDGVSSGSGSGTASFMTRYNQDGSKAWTRLLSYSSTESITCWSIGSDGSVYVAGYSYSAGIAGQLGSNDAFLTRYNSDGSKAWTQRFGGSSDDMAYSLETTADGSIYVAGRTYSTVFNGLSTSGGSDAFIVRYNPDGTKAWTQLVGGVNDDRAGVFKSLNGNIYVGGYSSNNTLNSQLSSDFTEGFLIRYNSDGTQAFAQTWSDLGSAQVWLNGFDSGVIVNDETLYAMGHTVGTNFLGQPTQGGWDGYVLKLSTQHNNAPSGNVSITGSAKVDQTLSVKITLTDADGLGAISYQWLADGVNINGATTSSFRLSQAQVGKAISVKASYVDLLGTAESMTSNVLHVVNYNTGAAENTTTVTTLNATDVLLSTAPKFTLTGLDASLFKISNKGVLTFATAKDYEQPVDANKDGVYEVSVTMTNTKTHYTVTKDLTVGVEFVPINGTAGSDNLKGTAGFDTLDGKAGDDKLTGGTGLDTFLVTSGHDTILDFNALTKGATGSEILQVSAGAVAEATLKAAWTATSDSFNDGTANLITKGMAVDLTGITHGQGWNVTNAGAATTIKGSQFNDVLTGGSGNDILLGGAGNDVLAGGKGADTLTGGSGADSFRLSGDTKSDHITDFLSGTDRIELDHLLYKALGTGQLAANQFAQGTAATTATQRIVYDQPTGNLWYDADGSGKGKAVLIGVLDNHVQIAHTDLYLI